MKIKQIKIEKDNIILTNYVRCENYLLLPFYYLKSKLCYNYQGWALIIDGYKIIDNYKFEKLNNSQGERMFNFLNKNKEIIPLFIIKDFNFHRLFYDKSKIKLSDLGKKE